MANSDESMHRLDTLEASVASLNRAMVQVSEILLDQNQRIDRVSARVDRLGDRVEAGFGRLDGRLERLEGRLDRLIDLQTRSFTDWVGQHQSHEQRLSQLEARVDRLEK